MKADLIKAARSAADALDDAAFLSKCDAQREPPSIGGDEKKTPGPKSGRPTLKHHITVARHHPGEACRATTARHWNYSISLTSVNGVWYSADGCAYAAGEVTHWAEMPKGPSQ